MSHVSSAVVALPIVLICSVDLELSPLLAHLSSVQPLRVRARQGWRGEIADRSILAVAGGMGKTNAAHTLTAILEAHRVAGIVGFGVAGAYPSSGLATESVAVAERQIYGDEGVRTPEGWWSCEGIGIPLVEDAAAPIFNDFPIEESAVDVIVGALAGAGISAARGPFVTVSCCSGTRAAGEELEQRFGAICETMEGAAYAHVARLYDVPYVEIRGISNLVEDRDFTRWRLAQAAAAAADATAIAAGAWHPRSASSIATVQT